MELFLKPKINLKKLGIFLVFILLINNFYNIKIVKAAAPWVTIEGGTNGIQETEVLGDQIIQTGVHNSANENSIRYKTLCYKMAVQRYNISEKFTSGSNASINVAYVPFVFGNETDNGTIKTTKYIIKQKDFMKAASNLGITGDYIVSNGSATVYLNNVFEIFQGNNTLDSYVYGYQEMLAEAPWTSATVNYLKGYYNFKYVISNNTTFKVKVVAVDSSGNVLDPDLLGRTKNAIYDEVIPPYTLSKNTISVGGVSYEYTSKWNYSYTDRESGGTVQKGPFSGNSVSFRAPDAAGGSTLTVRMVFDKKETSYQYNVVAIDAEGNYLRHLTSERVGVKSGDKVSYTPIDSFTKDSKKYKLQNKWYLKYKDTSGMVQTTDTKTAAKISNHTMPAAQNGSLATFYVIYGDGPPGTPTPTPKVTGIPTPTPTAAPTPTPPIPEVEVPAYDSAYSEFTEAVTTGEIRADDRGAEKFTATSGVPTTESLYGQVTAKEYLLGYFFEKKVGIKHYSVRVSKSYILTWKSATPGSAGGGKSQTETVTVTQYISVPRAYGYWEIMNLDYYNIGSAVLRNYALPGGSLTLTPDRAYYSPPAVSYTHDTSEGYHIIPPNEAVNGITLPSQTVSGGTSRPSVPREDFSYQALTQTGKCRVRSDTLVFGGQTVISGEITETEAPDINRGAIPQCTTFTNKNALYRNDQVIEARKKNGIYASNGTITYNAVARVGSSRGATANYGIAGINDVVIHTPVVCDPVVNADNDKYVQLVNPTDGCVELVLDPDPTLSDFTVRISNTGFHTGMTGYYTRDFSRSLHDDIASYIAEKNGLLRNEVRFPFDVFVDVGSDGKQKNDDYIKAGTWVTLGRGTARFYLPTWITEGVYTADFRTVAVNGEDYINHTETYANRDRMHYVATATVKFEVSGRIYGLTVYDVSDYPLWQEVFRIPGSSGLKKNSPKYTDGTKKTAYNKGNYYTYTVGTNDQYGNDSGRNVKYTFPLVNGSHPYYKNQGILKTGYMVRYSLDTIGNMYSDATAVVIRPSFYYVDKDGKNRKAVDLYYAEEINGKSRTLVKVGGATDSLNIKATHTGDPNLGIPQSEMKATAALRNVKYGKLFWQQSGMFTFSKIQLGHAFRMLVGQDYTASIKKLDCYGDIVASKITTSKPDKSMQRWYGQYYIPNDVHAAPKGYDVMDYAAKHGIDYDESFWLNGGYIIVNLDIYTIDEDKKKHLSYVNAANYKNRGNCSMWVMENPPLSKNSYKGPAFNFYAGDFCIYYSDRKMSEDYSPGAIY